MGAVLGSIYKTSLLLMKNGHGLGRNKTPSCLRFKIFLSLGTSGT